MGAGSSTAHWKNVKTEVAGSGSSTEGVSTTSSAVTPGSTSSPAPAIAPDPVPIATPSLPEIPSMPLVFKPSTRKPVRVGMERGFTTMDWNRKQASVTPVVPRPGGITMAEVRKHCTELDAWTVLRGKVYDITDYVRFHPGGEDMLMRAAGNNCDAMFSEAHSWVNIDEFLRKQYLGPVNATEEKVSEEAALHPDTWRPFPLASVTPISSDSAVYKLKLPEGKKLGMKPGQYLLMRLKKGAKDHIERAYTPISDADQEGYVELAVKLYSSGDFTKRLFAQGPGTGLELCGPRGGCTLDGPGQMSLHGKPQQVHSICMVAGGSGITPLYQLLLRLSQAEQACVGRVVLLYCSRRASGVMLHARLRELAKQATGRVRIVHFLSSEAAPPGAATADPEPPMAEENGEVWFEKGRISAAKMRQYFPPPGEGVVSLFSGPPSFNRTIRAALLTELRHEKERVYCF